MSLTGTTRASEVWRRAYYQLQQNKLLKKSIEFDMDIEGIAFTAGDIINIQKNIIRYGDAGRILSIYENAAPDQTVIKLDHIPDLTALATPVITIRLSDHPENGTLKTVTKPIASQDGQDIIISGFFTDLPVIGDSFTIGDNENVIKPYRVKGLTKTGDLQLKIIAIEYNEDVYLGDDQLPSIPNPSQTPTGSSAFYVTSFAGEEYYDITEGGIQRRFISVSFGKPAGVDRV